MQNIKTDLYSLADEIINELKANDIPALPENFTFYFDKLLEKKNDEFRKQINAITHHADEAIHKSFEYERSLTQGAKAVKLILTQGSNVYKNTTLLKKIIQTKKDMVASNADQETLLDVTASVETVLEKFLTSLEKQASSIKELYGTVATSIKTAKNMSVYNATLGVFNKKYFLTLIEKERELCNNSAYESSLISISLSNSSLSIKNTKTYANLVRHMGNVLANALRRSDSISYYGNGIFTILLRHTNETDAEIAAERFNRLISKAIFIDTDPNTKNEHILMGIIQIGAGLDAEELLAQSVEAMHSAAPTDTPST